jgi:hypothetical protein
MALNSRATDHNCAADSAAQGPAMTRGGIPTGSQEAIALLNSSGQFILQNYILLMASGGIKKPGRQTGFLSFNPEG